MISLQSNGYKISWGYDNAGKSKADVKKNNEKTSGNDKFTTLKNITTETLYKDVFSDVDLQYFVTTTGIKENIILKSAKAQNEFTLNYKIPNLTAKQKMIKQSHFQIRTEKKYTQSQHRICMMQRAVQALR